MPDLDELEALAKAATPVEPRDLMAYEHGGGRLAIIRDGRRDLIADFYGDGADRDFYAAANPITLLALIARVRAAEGDKRRMDWLVSQDVDVRTPLIYGSRKLFAAQAVGDLDADDAYRTTLREQIDAALSPGTTEGGGK